MNVLGIMSGTSLGSIDYAVCAVDGKRIKLKELWSIDYPKALQERLHQSARGDLKSWDFCQLHHDLGRFYAEYAKSKKYKVELIGLHGQTVFHNPDKKNPATFQMGEPAYLVEKLKAPVVSNFRVADLASGGQGAPLATIFHQHVFGEKGRHVCVNNLGGISNVTSIDGTRGKAKPLITSFDTGPANMLIDFAMRHFTKGKKEFDENGNWAARGEASDKLVTEWLRHSYFLQSPPKSTGRELFGEPFFHKAMFRLKGLSQFDVVATFTEFTARSLALNYQLHLKSSPQKVILTGGGAANPTLVKAIQKHLREIKGGAAVEVLTSDEIGWPVQSIEPAAFALLAWLRWQRKAGNIPGTTGARAPVLCGQISEA